MVLVFAVLLLVWVLLSRLGLLLSGGFIGVCWLDLNAVNS